jgi:YfiH family protein
VIERRAQHCDYLMFEHFAAVPGLAHGIFTRRGGFSAPPFDGLNVSSATGDDVASVRRNQAAVSAALELPLVSARPVHGAEVVVITADLLGGRLESDESDESEVPDAGGMSGQLGQLEEARLRCLRERLRAIHADAMLTEVPGLALFWAYGDCAPLLLVDPRRTAVGLVHAGWRGAAKAVVARAVETMRDRYGSRPDELLAGIGPAIGACCYEVTEAVRAAFAADPLAATTACFVERADGMDGMDGGKNGGGTRLYLDVARTAERQLLATGIPPANIETSGYCTGCAPDLFYSNRRGPRHGGRFGVAIGLRAG